MKTTAKLLIVILILGMMLPTLAACRDVMPLWLLDEQTRAVVILNRIDEIMLSSSSFTSVSETKVSGMSTFSPLLYTATTKEQVMNRNTKKLTYTSEMTNEFDYQLDEYDNTVTSIEGFTDEYAFRSVDTGAFKSMFKSPLTPFDISRYNENSSDRTSIPRFMLSSEKGDDGSWVVTISELDDEVVRSLSMDVSSIIPGYYITSCTIVLTVNKDFTSWTNEIFYTFEQIEGYEFPDGFFYRPVISTKNTFSDFNSTVVEEVDLTDYTLIDNVGIIDRISEDLLNKALKSYGKFYTNATHTLVYGSKSGKVEEKFDVEYGVKDGGFYHACYHYMGKEYLPISYSEGVRRDNGVKSSSSDDYERMFLYHVMTYEAYNPLLVKSVKVSQGKNGSTVYSFEIHVTAAMAAQYSVDAKPYTNGVITIAVTYTSGEISAVKANIRTWLNGDTDVPIRVTEVTTDFIK